MPGQSWKTALVGYILIGGSIVAFIADAVQKQGIPDTVMEWVVFGAMIASGIGAIMAKDFDVSNAPKPVAGAVVSKADSVKTNPSDAATV